MHILCAIKMKKMRELVAFALESQFDARVTEAATAAAAIEPILKDTKMDLIIADHPDNAPALLKLMGAVSKSIPCLIYMTDTSGEAATYASNPNVLAQLTGDDVMPEISKHIEELKKKLNEPTVPGDGGVEAGEEGNYSRIKVELLKGLNPLVADVFIRLGASKYLKLFNKGDSFEAQDRQKYLQEKKIQHLFVKKADAPLFLDHIQKDLKRLLKTATADPTKVHDVSVSVHEAAVDMIAGMGLTDESKEVIKSSVMLSVKALGKNPKLKGVLSRLTAEKGQYISSHSILLSQMACSIAVAMEWGSESTFSKLTMAAFFHDITLTNHELAQLQTRKEIEDKQKDYSKEEVRDYMLHAAKAAELVKTFGEIPPDTDSIIAQHHEQPDGTGFPRGLSHKQLQPLSCVFILSHDILTWMVKKGEAFVVKEFIEANKEKYSVGGFKKILSKLEHVEFQ